MKHSITQEEVIEEVIAGARTASKIGAGSLRIDRSTGLTSLIANTGFWSKRSWAGDLYGTRTLMKAFGSFLQML